jgi:hypothetical protein
VAHTRKLKSEEDIPDATNIMGSSAISETSQIQSYVFGVTELKKDLKKKVKLLKKIYVLFLMQNVWYKRIVMGSGKVHLIFGIILNH